MFARMMLIVKVLFGALALLVAAQTFNGLLTFSSLERLYAEIYAAGFRIAGQDAASKIETALRLGKPLDNFFGFERLTTDLRADLPDLSHVALVLSDGRVAKADPTPPPDLATRAVEVLEAERVAADAMVPPDQTPGAETAPAEAAPRGPPAGKGAGPSPGATVVKGAAHHFVVLPLHGPEGDSRGALVLAYGSDVLAERLEAVLETSTTSLLIASAMAAVVLVLAMRLIIRLARRQGRASWRLLAIPAVVLVAAQVVHSVQTVQVFRDSYLDAAQDNTLTLMEQIQEDVQFLMGKGLALTRMRGIESRLEALLGVVPELDSLSIIEAGSQEALYSVQSAPALVWGLAEGLSLSGLTAGDDRLVLSLPLEVADSSGSVTTRGRLVGHLDPAVIEANLRGRVLDAATILLVSLFFLFELFVLFGAAFRRSIADSRPQAEPQAAAAVEAPPDAAPPGGDHRPEPHLMARPVGFAFLVAWALPLSFIPLRMRALPEMDIPGLRALSESVILALPLSAEALCALFSTLLAGHLSDRYGWRVPLAIGFGLSVAGGIASGLADSHAAFIAARGLTGLGYGLVWMGIQAFVFQSAPDSRRGEGMSNLVAGLLAGFLCGTAVGAMTAERFGFQTVFLVSGALILVPGLLSLVVLRSPAGAPSAADRKRVRASQREARRAARQAAKDRTAGAAREVTPSPARVLRLMADRRFLAVMLLSVIPFSIAQVGLLYYTVPLYLDAQGLGQSNIGRIMMIYGISVIYLGPLIARWVDRTGRPRPFIAVGGLVGGLGLGLLALWGGVGMMILAVFLLGLASGLSEAARASFTVALPVVGERATGAMSLQRAADKMGQMLGPLILGALFAVTGIESGVSMIGLLYVACSVVFILASRPPRPSASGPGPGPG